jgi:membrane protein
VAQSAVASPEASVAVFRCGYKAVVNSLRGGPPPSNGQMQAAPSKELPESSFRVVARRVAQEARNKNLTMLGAALTYYGTLAAVPGLIVLFTAVGFLGRNVSNGVTKEVNSLAPGSSGHFVETLFSQAQSQKTGTGVVALLGLVIAIWSASSYISSFRQASNIIYEIGEGRPVWKTAAVRFAVTVVAVVLLVLCALVVVLSGSIASAVGNVIGVGHTAVTVWEYVKWPFLLVLVLLLIAVIFWSSPNVKQPGLKGVGAGGIVATLAWLLFSALFAVYVTHFSSYTKDYGPLAGMVVFLVWLWLSNLSLLLGTAVNAELYRQRAMAAGLSGTSPFVVPRDTRKLSDEDKEATRLAQQGLRQA